MKCTAVSAVGSSALGRCPGLTAGALAMRLRRLGVLRLQLDSDQRERLAAVKRQFDTICNEWQAHYEKKLLARGELAAGFRCGTIFRRSARGRMP